jgi:hypothetical protein
LSPAASPFALSGILPCCRPPHRLSRCQAFSLVVACRITFRGFGQQDIVLHGMTLHGMAPEYFLPSL